MEINAKFAQAISDLQAAGATPFWLLPCHHFHLSSCRCAACACNTHSLAHAVLTGGSSANTLSTMVHIACKHCSASCESANAGTSLASTAVPGLKVPAFKHVARALPRCLQWQCASSCGAQLHHALPQHCRLSLIDLDSIGWEALTLCLPGCAGATIVENFTIMGNSLGDQEWSGYIPITSTHDNGTVYNTGAFGYNNGSW